MNNTSTPTPAFSLGAPVDDLPAALTQDDPLSVGERRSRERAPHWWAAADQGRKNPGKWFPIKIPSFQASSFASSANAIRAGRLRPFREGRWDARTGVKCVWVKYIGPTTTNTPAPPAAPVQVRPAVRDRAWSGKMRPGRRARAAESISRNKSPYWWAAADYGRHNPGEWFRVEVPHLDPRTYNPAASHIRSGRLMPFREGRWDASHEENCVWIKYLGPDTDPITPDGRIDLGNLAVPSEPAGRPCPTCGRQGWEIRK